jgi:hypothetical protein
MAKYLLLYAGGGMPETEAEQATAMKAWERWLGELGPAVADAGNPFTSTVKTVSSGGSTTDGTATATGYSVIEADSHDVAAKLAGGCPVLLDASAQVMVFETVDVM